MGPVLAILLVAVLFAVFALLNRHGARSCDVHGCSQHDEPGGCASCHLVEPTSESNDEHE